MKCLVFPFRYCPFYRSFIHIVIASHEVFFRVREIEVELFFPDASYFFGMSVLRRIVCPFRLPADINIRDVERVL